VRGHRLERGRERERRGRRARQPATLARRPRRLAGWGAGRRQRSYPPPARWRAARCRRQTPRPPPRPTARRVAALRCGATARAFAQCNRAAARPGFARPSCRQVKAMFTQTPAAAKAASGAARPSAPIKPARVAASIADADSCKAIARDAAPAARGPAARGRARKQRHRRPATEEPWGTRGMASLHTPTRAGLENAAASWALTCFAVASANAPAMREAPRVHKVPRMCVPDAPQDGVAARRAMRARRARATRRATREGNAQCEMRAHRSCAPFVRTAPRNVPHLCGNARAQQAARARRACASRSARRGGVRPPGRGGKHALPLSCARTRLRPRAYYQ